MKAYCCSFYGFVLWDLANSSIRDSCIVWHKRLRCIWDLLHNTHCSLLPLLHVAAYGRTQLSVYTENVSFVPCMHTAVFSWCRELMKMSGKRNSQRNSNSVLGIESCVCYWTSRFVVSELLGRLPNFGSRPNTMGGKFPSVRPCVRSSTKSFFDFDEIWYTGSTRWEMKKR